MSILFMFEDNAYVCAHKSMCVCVDGGKRLKVQAWGTGKPANELMKMDETQARS